MTDRIVIHGQGEYDVFVGLGRCRGVIGPSRWTPPRSVLMGPASGRRDRVRRWLWEEIESGRVTVAELVGLHGRRLGVRTPSEGWFAEVLQSASMWALAEQARRLEVVFAERIAMLRGQVIA